MAVAAVDAGGDGGGSASPGAANATAAAATAAADAADAAKPAAAAAAQKPWAFDGWCWRRVSRLMNHGRDWGAVARFQLDVAAGRACLSDIGLAPAGAPAAGWLPPPPPPSPRADQGHDSGGAESCEAPCAAETDAPCGGVAAVSQRALRRQRESAARAARDAASSTQGDAVDQAQQQQKQQQQEQQQQQPKLRPKGRSKRDRNTYKLSIAYFGPAFDGWARQGGAASAAAGAEDASVEAQLSAALAQLLGSAPPAVACGGRTDKGVSAARQVASFAAWADLSDNDIARAAAAVNERAAARLASADTGGGSGGSSSSSSSSSSGNGTSTAALQQYNSGSCDGGAAAAPPLFRVAQVDRVPRVFHATWSAEWRRYVYLFPSRSSSSSGGGGDGTDLETCEVPGGCPGCLRNGWLAPGDAAAVDATDADAARVQAMLAALQGKAIDCTAFARDTPKGQPTVCTLHVARATVVELPPASAPVGGGGRRARALCVELVGDRFLRRMVRVLVSTALREATPGAAMSAAARAGGDGALVELAAMGSRLATAVPAPAVGLSFAAVGGSEYF